tara:strand:- start:1241 stop:1585 length:345 start_codon:yes stop_codon:yes gene_type:complete
MPIRNRFDAAVYIMNLPYETEAYELKEHITNSISAPCNSVNIKKKGAAVAFFSDLSHSISACSQLNGTLYKERKLIVKIHKFSSLVSKPIKRTGPQKKIVKNSQRPQEKNIDVE